MIDPEACNAVGIKYRLHIYVIQEKLHRVTIQYITKDRIENFDDYILCRKERCKLNHVTNWFCMFVDTYNNSMTS